MDTKEDIRNIETLTIGGTQTTPNDYYQYDFAGLQDIVDSNMTVTADTLTGGLTNSGTLSIGSLLGSSLTLGGGNSNVSVTTRSNTAPITGGYSYGWGAPNPSQLSLQGEDADIDINGQSLTQWMKKIEQRLDIMVTNPELEKDWDNLRKLGERYRKLEKKCIEKAEMWKKLKMMPAPRPQDL